MTEQSQNKAGIIYDRIIAGAAVAAAIIAVLQLAGVFTEVMARFVVRHSIPWIEEIAGMLNVWVAFLATAWVLKVGGHVTMDVLFEKFRPRVQAMVRAITSLVGAATFYMLTYIGILVVVDEYVHKYYKLGVYRIPNWPILLAIPIGSFLYANQYVREAYASFNKWRGISAETSEKGEEEKH